MSDRIPTDATLYRQWRIALGDLAQAELEAERAAKHHAQRIATAHQRCRERFATLAKAHGFDPVKSYAWDDETCELMPKD